MKKIYTTLLLAASALTASAQVFQSELAGKYHLQASYEFWEAGQDQRVYAHDDFTFSLEEQSDGTFRLYSFFYNGMNEQFERLGYGATAEYSPAEQLLYVYQTPWLWDEYMGQFMESYGYGQENAPMLYFLVERDPKTNDICLSSTKNSLGFYFSDFVDGVSTFVYAIDYPDVVRATKVPSYQSVTPTTLPGTYTMTYTDYEGREGTTTFSIEGSDAAGFTMKGIFGSKEAFPVFFDADGRGIRIDLYRPEKNGYYTAYFGSNVGDCRITFSFDAEGNLVSDNYFSYSPDFRNWTDAFGAVARKAGSPEGVSAARSEVPEGADTAYDLTGRRATKAGKGLIIASDGKKIMR